MSEDREVYTQEDVYEYILNHRIESYGSYMYDNDKIAARLMIELLKANGSVVMALFLKDDRLRIWWNSKVEYAKNKLSEKAEKRRLYELKLAAYERLTPAERKTLGIRKPSKPRG